MSEVTHARASNRELRLMQALTDTALACQLRGPTT
jgi:hypothetical protein